MKKNAAVLLVLLVSGIAMAGYVVTTIESRTTILEPIKVNNVEFRGEMYPGEVRPWSFEIKNEGNTTYGITVKLSVDDGITNDVDDGIGIDFKSVSIHKYPSPLQKIKVVTNLTPDTVSREEITMNIEPQQRVVVQVLVQAAHDMPSGTEVVVRAQIERGAPFTH